MSDAPKFSVMPLLDAKDERIQYVNLDAKFLADLSAWIDEGWDVLDDDTPVRLRVIAQRLEHLDEQVRNLTGALAEDDPVKAAYQAGIMEGKRRYLARSNLPLQSSELTPDLAKAVRESKVVPKRVEAGKPKPPVKPSVLSLAGIKLNLNFGKKSE